MDALSHNFRERVRLYLDPTDIVRRAQSPLEVSFSTNLEQGAKQHNLNSNLASSTKPWALTLSCLEVMSLPSKVICVPILQIWSDEQRAIGKILVTILSGVLVE